MRDLRADQKPDARQQQRQGAEHRRPALDAAGGQDRHRGNAEQLADDSAGDERRGLVQAFGGQVRDQSGVECNQRECGEAGRRAGNKLEPDALRHAKPRPQRCFGQAFGF